MSSILNLERAEVADRRKEIFQWAIKGMNWKGTIPATLATISFLLSIEAGPSCNYVKLRSSVLPKDQQFGLYVYLTTKRVPPSFELESTCEAYQSTANIGSMWKFARTFWILSIIVGFGVVCYLWKSIVTIPKYKSYWNTLLLSCISCCVLQAFVVLFFSFGHACYGSPVMSQPDSRCLLSTGSLFTISASLLWFFTLLSLIFMNQIHSSWFFYKLKSHHDDDEEEYQHFSANRHGGSIELQLREKNSNNLALLDSSGSSNSSSQERSKTFKYHSSSLVEEDVVLSDADKNNLGTIELEETVSVRTEDNSMRTVQILKV